jgi:aspartate/methionine/tyrosine aminotransferase
LETRLKPSRRTARVQMPVIPTVAGWIAETPGTISLGQGVVFYGPPPEAVASVPGVFADPSRHRYVHDPGLPELRKAFEEKLRRENGIAAPFERRIIVTAGANQGFLNAILCIGDPGDEVILLAPYYFNHEMAVRLAGCVPICVPTDERYQPRLEAVEAAVTQRTRAVVTVSPNNPTGAVYPEETLRAVNRLCADRGLYHISDEAYEAFIFDGAEHVSPGALGNDDGTISLFSLSKSFGMASWRVGFLVVPEHLYEDMLKIQDTVVVCAPGVSQHVGLEAMRAGQGYREKRLKTIARVRDIVFSRLADAPDILSVPPSRGAFYFLARVHASVSGLEMTERLVREHRVAVIPGETFGIEEGCFLRIGYGALSEDAAVRGIERLVNGIRAILG